MLNDHRIWLLSCGKDGKLADFNGWNLNNANLEFVDFSFALLNNVSLKNANLWGAHFTSAELKGADLGGAKILGGNLSGAQCEGTNFADANLEDANLEYANLYKTNFTGASLRRARFKGANISSSKMIDAYLEGTDFKGAKIEATNFEGANIDDAKFEETQRKALNIKKDLPYAKFKDDTMPNLQLSKTDSSEVGAKNHKSDMVTLNRTSNIKSAKEDLTVDLNAVDSAIIEAAINDLMEKLKSNIQLDQLKAICKQQGFIESIDKIDFKKGDLVMYDGQVAFKLNFNITHNFGLLVDRKGKFINVFWSTTKQIEK
jgi:uncharacterized protein YjbI with pentapeptide repeats